MRQRPEHKTPAAKYGLLVGRLGKGMGGIVNASRRFQAALIAELQSRGVTLTVWHLGTIQTAARWERVALQSQKVCREADGQSPRAKLDALQRCAFASAKRDECLKALGLDLPAHADDPLAQLAGMLRTPHVRTLDGIPATSETPEPKSCGTSDPTQSGDRVTDGQ